MHHVCPGACRFPYLHIKDKATYSNSNTKQHDADATRWVAAAAAVQAAACGTCHHLHPSPSSGTCESAGTRPRRVLHSLPPAAHRYLAYVLYPLVIGYAIYTLMYETHKSWYSWILNSLVGAVYTFGFILMCPQVRARQGQGRPCGTHVGHPRRSP